MKDQKTATLTIIHTLADGSYTAHEVRDIDITSWDTAMMQARDILRAKIRDDMHIISAILRSDFRTKNVPGFVDGAGISKIYQPREWSL